MNLENRKHLEAVAKAEMEKMFAEVPKAGEFHTGQWIDRAYYTRHVAETVLRIRLNNEVDAYALYKIGSKDNTLAAILAQYLAEEYGHEGLFMRDLAKFDVKQADLDAMPTLIATDKLIGYMYHSINRDGPLPTMIWNWFVEWYSDQYNKGITQKAAEAYGLEKVKGSMGHIEYDESHDHDDLMWGAVERAIKGWGNMDKAEAYLRTFVQLIGEYFTELHNTTVKPIQLAAA
jgi:hypothetical protein